MITRLGQPLLQPVDIQAARAHWEGLRVLLDNWVELGWLRATDFAFADTLARRRPQTEPAALLAAALLSHQVGQGHVLLDLEQALADPDSLLNMDARARRWTPDASPCPTASVVLQGLTIQAWRDALIASGLTAPPEQADQLRAPLVLAEQRLYLFRYWRFERIIETGINQRLQQLDTSRALAPAMLRPLLEALFPAPASASDTTLPEPETPAPDWQKLACALAARSPFAVITGGPGTGKTTTVLKLLALLQALALDGEQGIGRSLRIELAAPTGKAAARLNESIRDKVTDLNLTGLASVSADPEQIRQAIPQQVQTLHRLLGWGLGSRRVKYHRENPLAADVVVVDEASMVDEEMMARLIDALPEHARLILVGDKDQLASVEAGAVLGSLCARAADGHYPPDTMHWLEQVNGAAIPSDLTDPHGRQLDAGIAMLRRSYRFQADSGISALAQAINRGDAAASQQILTRAAHPDLHLIRLSGAQDPTLARLLCNPDDLPSYANYLQVLHTQRPDPNTPQPDRAAFDTWATEVIQAHSRFQLLAALREGEWGVRALNQRVTNVLRQRSLLPEAGDTDGWYEGRPVIVTRNDYGLGLMNGDVGIALKVPARSDQTDGRQVLRVAFPRGDEQQVHWVLPSRLQHCETVFAMTVHKSQGSEFTHAALLLPDTSNPVLTRELIYTAVTRASQHCSLLVGNETVLLGAIERTTRRETGLFTERDESKQADSTRSTAR